MAERGESSQKRGELEKRVEEHWPAIAAAQIAVFTLSGIVVGFLFDGAGYDRTVSIILVAVLTVVAISSIVTVRAMVLPTMMRAEEARQETVQITAYSFVVAIPIYGLVAAVSLGNPLVPLLFLALALIGYYAVWSFFQEEAPSLRR